MAKSKEKIQARLLRKNGLSIKEVAKKLNVSPGSVSVWCKDILLTQAQIKVLEKNMRDPHYGRRALYLQKIKNETEEKINLLKKQGIKEIGKLTEREFFITGASLYWAEGFKRDKQMGFSNMDPKMIIFFISWLKKCLMVKDNEINLRVTVNQTYVKKIHEVEDYWSKVTNIPLSNFQKATIQKTKWKKVYENKDQYYGVLRIRVRKSLGILRKMLGWIEGLYLNSISYEK